MQPFLVAILNFCVKRKNVFISVTVQGRLIWAEFFTRNVYAVICKAKHINKARHSNFGQITVAHWDTLFLLCRNNYF